MYSVCNCSEQVSKQAGSEAASCNEGSSDLWEVGQREQRERYTSVEGIFCSFRITGSLDS